MIITNNLWLLEYETRRLLPPQTTINNNTWILGNGDKERDSITLYKGLLSVTRAIGYTMYPDKKLHTILVMH